MTNPDKRFRFEMIAANAGQSLPITDNQCQCKTSNDKSGKALPIRDKLLARDAILETTDEEEVMPVLAAAG